MTSWVWTCRSCGYEMEKYIGDFTEECPSCNTEYKLLGIAYGMHQLSPLPIYSLKNEPMDNEKTNNQITVLINCRAKRILCYTEDFNNYLRENFEDELTKKNILVELE